MLLLGDQIQINNNPEDEYDLIFEIDDLDDDNVIKHEVDENRIILNTPDLDNVKILDDISH